MRKKQSISNQLRQILAEAAESRYRIAKETGLGEAMLSRFMHGKGGLSMKGLDEIGTLLDLEIRRRGPTAKKKKGKR